MNTFLRWIWRFFIVGLLTLFTQTGGLLYLLVLPFLLRLDRWEKPWAIRSLAKLSVYSSVYVLVNLLVVPPLAKMESGRVPLPVFGNESLRPQQVFYFCLLNRHYVRPEVLASCERVAGRLSEQFTGISIHYLDANFPFFDGYPLEPHFTHRYGTTVDVALHWKDTATQAPIVGAPTALAYGYSALPKKGEVDYEERCNNWLRSLELRFCSMFNDMAEFQLDEARTGALIREFAKDKSVKKILLEPHLKTRLRLDSYDKIRFQGCKAARHDDHIHVIW